MRKKTSFKMLGLTFSSKLDWGSYIVSITKTASKKIGALIRSMKFLSPEVALYLYKSTIRPCMEYCCHVWAGAPSCYLELLDKLQKRICRTVGPSLAASLEPQAHRRNVACLSLFYRYYFGRCFFFFSIWVFFHEHSRITGLQGNGEGISFTPRYHFHPLNRHLDIGRAITAGSSPLRIASSRTRTGNIWSPSASR